MKFDVNIVINNNNKTQKILFLKILEVQVGKIKENRKNKEIKNMSKNKNKIVVVLELY